MFSHEEIMAAAMQANIQLVPGNVAPRYNPCEVNQLLLDQVVITEQGTGSNLPLVDLVFKDENGKRHFTMLSGRILQTIAKAIDGVNIRNHGNPNPE